MKLSEMKQLLVERGILLTKSLGQNFLHDGNQLRRIAAAAELKPSDSVLEVGPGLGPLTALLLAEAGCVLAIEKDRRLVEVLRERFAGQPKLQLEHADALEQLRARRDWSGWKMVSNLPYSVASPLLVELAQAERGPERIVATLQWEVVRRIMAAAGEPDYGLLSLLVQLEYRPAAHFRIPPGCFHPEPEVDSACLVLERRPGPGWSQERREVWMRVVKRAFSQRRKMMLKLLKADWPEARLVTGFAEAGLDRQTRAETVSREQFIRLADHLSSTSAVL
jgi:16S rRNA (adenine1518-N6/adenine1519-N6)-dimethyltransferase